MRKKGATECFNKWIYLHKNRNERVKSIQEQWRMNQTNFLRFSRVCWFFYCRIITFLFFNTIRCKYVLFSPKFSLHSTCIALELTLRASWRSHNGGKLLFFLALILRPRLDTLYCCKSIIFLQLFPLSWTGWGVGCESTMRRDCCCYDEKFNWENLV